MIRRDRPIIRTEACWNTSHDTYTGENASRRSSHSRHSEHALRMRRLWSRPWYFVRRSKCTAGSDIGSADITNGFDIPARLHGPAGAHATGGSDDFRDTPEYRGGGVYVRFYSDSERSEWRPSDLFDPEPARVGEIQHLIRTTQRDAFVIRRRQLPERQNKRQRRNRSRGTSALLDHCHHAINGGTDPLPAVSRRCRDGFRSIGCVDGKLRREQC